MQYNTAKDALITIDTTDGNVDLSWGQVTTLLNVSTTAIELMTAYSGTGIYDKLIVDIDLGVRVHTSEIRYYFNSTVSSGAMASGISFQYKDEEFQTQYIQLPTFFNQNYYYTNTSGTVFAPRCVKLIHDLYETDGFLTTLNGCVSGTLHGLEILNDDTYVNFGADGTTVGDTVSIAKDGDADIREIPIYNSGVFKSTAYVSLDPTYTNLDKVTAVSLTADGPWVFPQDTDYVIFDVDNYSDWGTYDNAELKDNIIQLSPYYTDANGEVARMVENGSYTTRIFSSTDITWNSIIIDRVLPLNGSLQVDPDDGTETIEISSSNYKPKPYHIYREFYVYNSGSTNYLRYRDTWVETGQVKYTSTVDVLSATYYTTWRNYFIVIDPVTERWGGFAYHYHNNSSVTAQWYLLNITSSDSVTSKLMAQQSVTATVMSFDWRDLKFTYDGGMWVYFYSNSYRDSDFVEDTGYYLCYFDSGLTNQFKYFTTTDFVGAMDVHYDTRYLWYTLPASNQIQKIDYNGTVLHNHFENANELGGLCVLSDGSVWYANAKDVYKLKSNGTIEEEISDVADDLFIQMAKDGDGSEALWVLENFYISRLIISGANKGKKEFSVYLEHSVRLYPVESGVWVRCVDVEGSNLTYMHYISKVNKRVDKEYTVDYSSTFGPLEYTYEDEQYISKMPLAIDQYWLDVEWQKVNTESFILSEDHYHRARITLRRQLPYQRYGDTVAVGSVFATDDNFNQTETKPNNAKWGGYLSDERVYVQNNQLVLLRDPDPLGTSNTYIRTRDRYLLTGNFDVQFDYIMGDGTDTGKDENLYLEAYATDAGKWDQYLRLRVNIVYPNSGNSVVYYYVNGGMNDEGLGFNYDRWIGKLRLKRDGDRFYGYVWDPQTSSWIGRYVSGVNGLGNYFYIQIQSSRTGSDIYIDNFTVNAGTAYYYADTPKVKGLYIRKEIEVEDIYPNNSKSIYLKSHVPVGLVTENHYDTNLKARWRTPIQ